MTSIGRIIDALFRNPDETVSSARLEISYTESGEVIEVGPHPGFTSGSMVVVLSHSVDVDGRKSIYELEFRRETDVREARALAAALTAWANWAESVNAPKVSET